MKPCKLHHPISSKQKATSLLFLIFLWMFSGCSNQPSSFSIHSPDKNTVIDFELKDGVPHYQVIYKDKHILNSSSLGFELKDQPTFDQFEVTGSDTSTFYETWKPVWGQKSTIENHYTALTVSLQERNPPHLQLTIEFRVFNDGVAFRYTFPKQAALDTFSILQEKTSFHLSGDPLAWWIPADYDSYERLYTASRVSAIPDAIKNNSFNGANEIYMQDDVTQLAVATPVTMRTDDGIYLSFHEANLTDYAEMTLRIDSDSTGLSLISDLVPWPDGEKVKTKAPCNTPWRTLQIAETPGGLAMSDLIQNLNPPCAIQDVSWIKPSKYIGIWWGYHIGKYTWDYPGTKERPHGASTENAKAHIDFAAAHGIGGVLTEGWAGYLNRAAGTSHDVSDMRADYRNYSKGHPDFDLEEVAGYAKSEGVELIIHNETMGQVNNYESQLEQAYDLYQKLGIHYIKTGYAWHINAPSRQDNGPHYHHSQYMVRHYQKVVEEAAKRQIMICAHEPIKDTGISRTYPNMLTREGVRGNEYNPWVKAHGNPPEHTTIIPFTRCLSGPVDFTPGTFDIKFDKYRKEQRVNTTLAKQLALMVVLYSPLQMANDLIENYEDHPAFQFIQDVPCTWDESRILDAVIGDYVVTARRKEQEWFLGAITDEEPRTLTVTLDFLEEGKTYHAEIYEDGKNIDFDTNPTDVNIRSIHVQRGDSLTIKMAKSGGMAVRLKFKV